jgi:hypothetical protein
LAMKIAATISNTNATVPPIAVSPSNLPNLPNEDPVYIPEDIPSAATT